MQSCERAFARVEVSEVCFQHYSSVCEIIGLKYVEFILAWQRETALAVFENSAFELGEQAAVPVVDEAGDAREHATKTRYEEHLSQRDSLACAIWSKD